MDDPDYVVIIDSEGRLQVRGFAGEPVSLIEIKTFFPEVLKAHAEMGSSVSARLPFDRRSRPRKKR